MKEKEFEIQSLSLAIKKAADCLHNSIRYIYAISENDFYNIHIKDLFKISLLDIGNPDVLSNLGITPSDDFAGGKFTKLADLFFYAFAVRIPYLVRSNGGKANDKFILALYQSCVEKGAADPEGVVGETLIASMSYAKSNQPEPPFNGEWFRRWIYSKNGVKEMAVINNRNIFLLGSMDALIPLIYAKLTDNLVKSQP